MRRHTLGVLNKKLRAALKHVWRGLCWLLLRVLPPRQHAIVYGWPDDEGNAVEVVRALRRRYCGRIYWLLQDPSYVCPAHAASELSDAGRISRVRKNSPLSLILALTAETTFFTHGLFTAVDPPDDRLVVNLWHGDGPKAIRDANLIRSTVLVAGTALWGPYLANLFGVESNALAIVGHPRVDQFTAATRAEVLTRLGLDPNRLIVLWLPTYRAAKAPHNRTWSDAHNLSGSSAVEQFIGTITDSVRDLGLQVVVKPHPLDADVYETLDIPIFRRPELDNAGVTSYQLLGAADAIISDISSIWTDFLRLDRPVGFYVPDLDELQRRRGLNVDDVGGLLPGPRIETPQDVRHFLETIATDPTVLRPSSYPAFGKIGVADGDRVADRLLDWLDNFQQARHRNSLFADNCSSTVS